MKRIVTDLIYQQFYHWANRIDFYYKYVKMLSTITSCVTEEHKELTKKWVFGIIDTWEITFLAKLPWFLKNESIVSDIFETYRNHALSYFGRRFGN